MPGESRPRPLPYPRPRPLPYPRPHPQHRPHADVVDPDVDLHDPAQAAETRPREWDLLVVIAVGGVAGAEARYGLGRALPDHTGHFPWTTLLINVVGSALIGVLMVIVLEVMAPHRYVRPFVGVGVLGGFTTYSTFSVEVIQLVDHDRPGLAAAYIAGSFVLCCVVAAAAIVLTRAVADLPPDRTPA